MKKVSTLLISFVYLVWNTGFILSLHFCGGSLADFSVNLEKDFCGEPANTTQEVVLVETNSCCQTIWQVVSLDTDQIPKTVSIVTAPDFSETNTVIVDQPVITCEDCPVNLNSHPPPGKTPRYIQFSSLIFYA